jgi:uncharacterized protein YndB with AHSA1/START domain
MTDQMTDLSLTISRRIKAPATKLFDAWLDPLMLARFMRGGEGVTVIEASTEARVGGRFSVLMKVGDKEVPHAGTYFEITPHSRLSFSWESPYTIDGSTVTLTFTPEPEGTLVTLEHVRFPSEQSREGHRGGWTSILAALDEEMA